VTRESSLEVEIAGSKEEEAVRRVLRI